MTLGAKGEGMVAGDLVNTASRLQSVAAPGSVLVGEATYRAASNGIAFEPAGDHVVKGKDLPLAAWRAVRVVAGMRGMGRQTGIEPPFVGRDAEMQLLRDLYHATVRERRARLVSVIGVAGIGKSRLSWELLKYLDGLVEVLYWHQGRSPAYGDGVTFWALGEMVRRRAGSAETDDETATGRRSPRCSNSSCRTKKNDAGSRRGCWPSWASRTPRPAPARSSSPRGGRSSSESPTKRPWS